MYIIHLHVKKNYAMKQLFLLSLLLGAIACNKNTNRPNKSPEIIPANLSDRYSLTPKKDDKTAILSEMNQSLLRAIKEKNFKVFAEYIHPEKGIRFSMYGFVSVAEDKFFSKNDFIKYFPTNTVFTWGKQDGSGFPFRASIKDYITKWVFAKDFSIANVTINKFQAEGNSLNNLNEIYPNTDFVENYIKGTPKNSELDWKTLRFVFEELNGKYYLVAVINDQWTV